MKFWQQASKYDPSKIQKKRDQIRYEITIRYDEDEKENQFRGCYCGEFR